MRRGHCRLQVTLRIPARVTRSGATPTGHRRMRIISTHATEWKVKHWAASAPKRIRAKYKHAITVCRVVNRRDAPVLLAGVDWRHERGDLGSYAARCIRFSWGSGYVRDGVSTFANRGARRGWKSWRREPPWRLPSLGWYGSHFLRHRPLARMLGRPARLAQKSGAVTLRESARGLLAFS